MTVRICQHCGGEFSTCHPGRAKFCGQPCYFEASRLRNPARTRFLSMVEVAGDDECWLWKGKPLQTGYGQFWLNGKNVTAHRASYTLLKGVIPDGMLVLHRCDNPQCVNPRHLFPGTHADNMVDKVSKGRGNSPTGGRHGSKTMPHRVPRGEAKAAQAKLTNEAVLDARAQVAAGALQRDVAARLNVSPSLISRVVRGQRWQ